MKNVKCVIRKNLKTTDNEHLIYLRYTYNRKYILIRTEIYVKIKNWNSRVGRLRKSVNYEIKNDVLEKKENHLERIILELISEEKEPTLINVKKEYYKNKNKFKTKQINQENKMKESSSKISKSLSQIKRGL